MSAYSSSIKQLLMLITCLWKLLQFNFFRSSSFFVNFRSRSLSSFLLTIPFLDSFMLVRFSRLKRKCLYSIKLRKKWTTHERCKWKWTAENGSDAVRFLWFIAQFFYSWDLVNNKFLLRSHKGKLVDFWTLFCKIDFLPLEGFVAHAISFYSEGGSQFSTFPPLQTLKWKSKQIFPVMKGRGWNRIRVGEGKKETESMRSQLSL